MSSRRAALLCATILAAGPAMAGSPGDTMTNAPIPPVPSAAQVDAGSLVNGRGANTPVTGAAVLGRITGGQRPPSLEKLQALRPSKIPETGAEGMRARAVCDEAKAYGAQGGLAARAFAINEILRRHEAALDRQFDFSGVAIPTAGRSTLLLPPVVTEAQMASALGDGGQRASETARIYRITREGRLTLAVPNWRSYLVREWAPPSPPGDTLRARTDREASMWTQCVTDGWAEGERLGTETFLSDLATLETELVGMMRYHVLLRAGVVEQPQVAARHIRIQGGGNQMQLNNTEINITRQRGLNPNSARWRETPNLSGSPIGTIGR